MEFLGGDANLGTESELCSVGEGGGGIVVDTGGIHLEEETVGSMNVLGNDTLAMAGTVGTDMRQGLVQSADDAYAQIVREPLAAVFAIVELHLSLHGGKQFRQARFHVLVHQQTVQGVANTDTAALGIMDNALCLVHVGILVHIAVHHSGTGLDDGHLGVLAHIAYQSGRTAGDYKVHQTLGRKEFGRCLACGWQEGDGGRVQTVLEQDIVDNGTDGLVAFLGIRTAL